MSFLDPRSHSCPFNDLFNEFPLFNCPYYQTDLYYGFVEACIHPECKHGQKECPLGYKKKEESNG